MCSQGIPGRGHRSPFLGDSVPPLKGSWFISRLAFWAGDVVPENLREENGQKYARMWDCMSETQGRARKWEVR